MKKLKISILNDYKLYKKNTEYHLCGDLIVLSGVNGSGKSQLMNIISQQCKEKIERTVFQAENDINEKVENIALFSFRDNIGIGEDFGKYAIGYHQSNIDKAWEFYEKNIKFSFSGNLFDNRKKINIIDNNAIYDEKGVRNSSWRSILTVIDLLKQNYSGDKLHNLTKEEFEKIIPVNFIWRNDNDIINQIGNIFYIACCNRVDKQIEYSKTNECFDNNTWLKDAPWTILNDLFKTMKFKYRFKSDYEFHTPIMDENPKLRDGNNERKLSDLSDGEKAILKLALFALDEELSKDVKLVLFDEFDATLNPSLINSFYYVINNFYVNKGVQVIISTHSSSTISMAPDNACFYEIFNDNGNSPKIISVGKYQYDELSVANKSFYEKIINQEHRILELENLINISGKVLLVEDQYTQIYKIAYLKLKGVDDINKDNLDDKFLEHSNFQIHGGYSTGGLYNILSCQNTSRDHDDTVICLFDFDSEGYAKFKKVLDLRDGRQQLYSGQQGDINCGFYTKHLKSNRYALMLPIPDRLVKYINMKCSSYCFVEIETLIAETFLETCGKAEKCSEALDFYKLKDSHKKDFWVDLLSAKKEIFVDFEKLFSQVEFIFCKATIKEK